MPTSLEYTVYPYTLPPGIRTDRIPGLKLERIMRAVPSLSNRIPILERKLEHSCRKICTMCYAGERAFDAERDFYLSTVREAPALIGDEAIELFYHLEAFVFFARSSLDVAADIFGDLLLGKRFDSFNDLTKLLAKDDRGKSGTDALDGSFISRVKEQRGDKQGWLSILCGAERGRALRDKVAHQTGFPIDYEELYVESEKEYAVVRLSKDVRQTLGDFLNMVRDGVLDNFLAFEDEIERLRCGDAPVGRTSELGARV